MTAFEKRSKIIDLPEKLRIGENLADTIRRRATANDRTIQLEILHLIKVGLRAEPIDLDSNAAD